MLESIAESPALLVLSLDGVNTRAWKERRRAEKGEASGEGVSSSSSPQISSASGIVVLARRRREIFRDLGDVRVEDCEGEARRMLRFG